MMTLRKATFTVTVASDLSAYDDATLSGYTGTRGAWLEAVRVDSSQASSRFASVGIYQVDTDDDTNSTELERVQLVQIDSDTAPGVDPMSDPAALLYPRVSTNSAESLTTDSNTSSQRRLIASRTCRCRIEPFANIPLVAGDVYTVDMWYETAGDYRF